MHWRIAPSIDQSASVKTYHRWSIPLIREPACSIEMLEVVDIGFGAEEVQIACPCDPLQELYKQPKQIRRTYFEALYRISAMS